jgi:proline-specific peptidase
METEGRLDVPGGRVWYRRLGAGDATPLLMLHGGPGAGSDYIAPLGEALAADRPVVLWDQLGCGRSEQPDDTSLWTLDRFVAEVDAVRDALGLDRIHLFGQSWGGWLAIEYVARGTTGVERLVLASTSASAARTTPRSTRRRSPSSTFGICAAWTRGPRRCRRASPTSTATRCTPT